MEEVIMKSKLLVILTVCFIFSIFSFNVLAQDEEPKPQLYMVWEYVVKPDMVNEVDSIVKKRNAILKKHKYPYTQSTSSSSDFHYYFSTPIENLAEVEEINRELNKIDDPEWQETSKESYDNYYYFKQKIVTFRPDLSYLPESRLQEEEGNFRSWGFFYVKPGKTSEFVEIMKKWVELYKEKNIPTGFRTHSGGIGTDRPWYYLGMRGKSAAAFFTQTEKNYKILGADSESLWNKTKSVLRKYEMKIGMYRPDLSYIVEQ
jgi:hypothetical protein